MKELSQIAPHCIAPSLTAGASALSQVSMLVLQTNAAQRATQREHAASLRHAPRPQKNGKESFLASVTELVPTQTGIQTCEAKKPMSHFFQKSKMCNKLQHNPLAIFGSVTLRENVPPNVTLNFPLCRECGGANKRKSPRAEFCSASCQHKNWHKRIYQPATLRGKRCRCGKIHRRQQSDFCSQRCKDKFSPAPSRKNNTARWREYYARNRKHEIARSMTRKRRLQTARKQSKNK